MTRTARHLLPMLFAGAIAAAAYASPSGADAAASGLSLSLGDVRGAGFAASGVRLRLSRLSGVGPARVEIGQLAVGVHRFSQLSLDCPALDWSSTHLKCGGGQLREGRQTLPVSFEWWKSPQRFSLTLQPPGGERWQLDGRQAARGLHVDVSLDNARAARVGQWLPDMNLPAVDGRVSGRAALDFAPDGLSRIDGRIGLQDVKFSDAAGLHAGEHLTGQFDVAANRQGRNWRWQAQVGWRAGGVFWQPFYLKGGGHALTAKGSIGPAGWRVDQGDLTLPGVGSVRLAGAWDARQKRLADYRMTAAGVDLGALYQQVLKPLAGAGMASLKLSGQGDVHLEGGPGGPTRIDLALRHATVADATRGLSAGPLDAQLPWRSDADTVGHVALAGGRWQHVPVGAVDATVRMRGASFAIDRLTVPILDGALHVSGLTARRAQDGWQGRFAGSVDPISMAKLSSALGWPRMEGSLSGEIPDVSYSSRLLRMDGALTARVFQGNVVINALEVHEPLAPTSTLHANVYMRNLDLGSLTHAFSFGSIEGRLDADIDDLELQQWRPVAFNARLMSSPGSYRKKISQQAVKNIAALGGDGPVAALERSFLQFFKEFGYDRIGVSCVLKNSVCQMGGVSDASGGFVLVKGGGIPAITVLGFNRRVNWTDLLDRLSRVTASNVQPVVK